MFPYQWTPKYSPTYLEFAEHFGGCNFGGGNAQLDLETMASSGPAVALRCQTSLSVPAIDDRTR
jgi:hypothetical protein